ncbi:MAG TPA: LON peptidase substrate-binding domain-containing protein [Ornithinibacter sp.]|nr:LON peptidase substrate-binding domain-containing protein [Ornithinibacter sp.]
MATLPLFPLGTVLLPGARIPLQLFEPRYLELARDLAGRDEDDRRFGVTLIRAGREVGADAVADLYEIGCEARVDAMALADSSIGTVVHLVATGARRYRLDALETGAGTPWTTGRVTWLDEPAAGDPGHPGDPTVRDLEERALREHTAYLLDLGAKADPVEAAPSQLAYRIAEAMVLDASDRQRVLEGADPATRLRTVIALLRRERAIVGRFGAVPTPPMPFGPSLN